jgi:hypothetical protein
MQTLYGQVAECSYIRECVKNNWKDPFKNEILHNIEDEGDILH